MLLYFAIALVQVAVMYFAIVFYGLLQYRGIIRITLWHHSIILVAIRLAGSSIGNVSVM